MLWLSGNKINAYICVYLLVYVYIFQKLDGFNSNILGGQSKGFDFPNENSGMDIGTTEYSNSNYRTRYNYYSE